MQDERVRADLDGQSIARFDAQLTTHGAWHHDLMLSTYFDAKDHDEMLGDRGVGVKTTHGAPLEGASRPVPAAGYPDVDRQEDTRCAR